MAGEGLHFIELGNEESLLGGRNKEGGAAAILKFGLFDLEAGFIRFAGGAGGADLLAKTFDFDVLGTDLHLDGLLKVVEGFLGLLTGEDAGAVGGVRGVITDVVAPFDTGQRDVTVSVEFSERGAEAGGGGSFIKIDEEIELREESIFCLDNGEIVLMDFEFCFIDFRAKAESDLGMFFDIVHGALRDEGEGLEDDGTIPEGLAGGGDALEEGQAVFIEGAFGPDEVFFFDFDLGKGGGSLGGRDTSDLDGAIGGIELFLGNGERVLDNDDLAFVVGECPVALLNGGDEIFGEAAELELGDFSAELRAADSGEIHIETKTAQEALIDVETGIRSGIGIVVEAVGGTDAGGDCGAGGKELADVGVAVDSIGVVGGAFSNGRGGATAGDLAADAGIEGPESSFLTGT